MLEQLEKIGSPMMLTTLRRIETEKQEPKLSEAKAIAQILGKTVDELAEQTGTSAYLAQAEKGLQSANQQLNTAWETLDRAIEKFLLISDLKELKQLDKQRLTNCITQAKQFHGTLAAIQQTPGSTLGELITENQKETA